MPANAALRDYLLTRRSVGIAFLKEPGPTPAEGRLSAVPVTAVPGNGRSRVALATRLALQHITELMRI